MYIRILVHLVRKSVGLNRQIGSGDRKFECYGGILLVVGLLAYRAVSSISILLRRENGTLCKFRKLLGMQEIDT